MQMCDIVTWCDVTKSQKIKGGTTDEAFQEQCFVWERGAPVVVDFFTFKIIHMQQNLYNTKGKEILH